MKKTELKLILCSLLKDHFATVKSIVELATDMLVTYTVAGVLLEENVTASLSFNNISGSGKYLYYHSGVKTPLK